MKKVFTLKKWNTLEDVIKELSLRLKEEISKADIYQLVLEKQLKLSIYFPEREPAKKCHLTEDIKIVQTAVEKLPCLITKEEIWYSHYDQYEKGKYIRVFDDVEYIEQGIYEILLIGSSNVDLLNCFNDEKQILSDGTVCLAGVYVKDKNNNVFEIQDIYKLFENEEQRKTGKKPSETHFMPCPSFQHTSGIFAIQTEHLNEFLSSLDDENQNNLTIDNSLYLLGEVLNAVKSKAKKWTQSTIIDEILLQRQNHNKPLQGLEQRKIEDYFSAANKKLKTD